MLCGPPPLPTHTLWTPPSCSPWDPLKDIAQFEQDGVLHTLQRETAFLGSPGPRHQVRTSPGLSLGSSAPTSHPANLALLSWVPITLTHTHPSRVSPGVPLGPCPTFPHPARGQDHPPLAGHAVPGTPRCSGHCARVHWPCPVAPQNRSPWCWRGGIPLYR